MDDRSDIKDSEEENYEADGFEEEGQATARINKSALEKEKGNIIGRQESSKEIDYEEDAFE